MAGPALAPRSARLIVVRQTGTIPASGKARLGEPHRWQDRSADIELLYGHITQGTPTDLKIQLTTGEDQGISGTDFVELESFCYQSPPERPDANIIGITRTADGNDFAPELENETGADIDVTINWFFLIKRKTARSH